jgi:hypothetical protein
VSMHCALSDLTSVSRKGVPGKSGHCLRWQLGGDAAMLGFDRVKNAKLPSKKSL